MRIELVTDAAVEPVHLDEVKDWLEVDYSDDDADVWAILKAARRHVEEVSGRALAAQTYKLTLDRFPCGPTLPLPRPPLRSVTSVTYLDTDGTEQTWASSNYEVIADGTPGAIYTENAWPATSARPGSVRVTFVAGYGNGDEAAPPELLLAVRQLARHWYDQRSPVATGTISSVIQVMTDRLIGSLRFRYTPPQECEHTHHRNPYAFHYHEH